MTGAAHISDFLFLVFTTSFSAYEVSLYASILSNYNIFDTHTISNVFYFFFPSTYPVFASGFFMGFWRVWGRTFFRRLTGSACTVLRQ